MQKTWVMISNQTREHTDFLPETQPLIKNEWPHKWVRLFKSSVRRKAKVT